MRLSSWTAAAERKEEFSLIAVGKSLLFLLALDGESRSGLAIVLLREEEMNCSVYKKRIAFAVL